MPLSRNTGQENPTLVNHETTESFWKDYDSLPTHVEKTTDQNVERLKSDPQHSSLHFKPVGRYYSARVSLNYRALAILSDDILVWFWTGTHAEYNALLKR